MHNRKLLRLKGYNYSQNGMYFITICTKYMEKIFGNVVNGTMILNEYGKIAEKFWLSIAERYDNVHLDEYIIMPDHFHGIIIIENDPIVTIHELSQDNVIHELFPQSKSLKNNMAIRESPVQHRKMLLPKIIGYFKMNVAKKINEINCTQGIPVWHRSYYDHIIRNQIELYNIRKYIINNPIKSNINP